MFFRDSTLGAYVFAAVDMVICVIASGHVLLFKRDTRAAIGWIGLIWLSPVLGAVLYLLLGINRIHRRARSLRRGRTQGAGPRDERCESSALIMAVGCDHAHLATLSEVVDKVARSPLLPGNAIEALDGGDEAYPEMIKALDEASHSIALSTFIFDHDRAGRPFVEALSRAVRRGVAVRVLIDDFGARHRWPSVIRVLQRGGVPVARFLPTLAPGWFPYLNLRNHRKILVVDGRIGYTGGMNILEDYLLSARPRHPKRDLHVRLEGPAVAGLLQVFTDDWALATGEELRGDAWTTPVVQPGDVFARVVDDGPDNDRDTLLKVMLGGLACARSYVAVATPYFLPDARLISALETAALRGVEVNILLPSRSNHRLVQWASTAAVRDVMEGGCRVWASPSPFDHTKLMIVDRGWSFVGSANWDPRSLRLNFEVNLECYGTTLATQLDRRFQERLREARELTTDEIDARRLPSKLRDGAARLLSPYL